MHTNASNGRAGRHLRKVGQLSRVPGAGGADEERTTLGCMSCMWAGTFLSCGALGQQAGAAAGAHLLVDQVCPEARALLLVRAPVPAQRLVSWLNVRLQNGKGGQAARSQERLWVRGCGFGWGTGPCPAGVAGGSAHPPRTSGGPCRALACGTLLLPLALSFGESTCAASLTSAEARWWWSAVGASGPGHPSLPSNAAAGAAHAARGGVRGIHSSWRALPCHARGRVKSTCASLFGHCVGEQMAQPLAYSNQRFSLC